MPECVRVRSCLFAGLITVVISACSSPAAAQTSRPASPPDESSSPTGPAPTNPRWLERLGSIDRALLNELRGFAPPVFTEDLTWIEAERRTWTDMRGKVVLIHSWTSASSVGRRIPARLKRLRATTPAEDLEIILLHTPEGVDKVQKILERRPTPLPVVIDSKGAFCNALGVYRRPVSILVDRNGVVRHVGLNARGLLAAIEELVAETHDPDKKPSVRPEPEKAEPTEFPSTTGPVGRAADYRGRRAPDFRISKWITPEPNAAGKVVVIDFWATWCGPYVASIPHVNLLADRFAGQVCFVAISDESSFDFDRGLDDHDLDERDFRYTLALDTASRMKDAMGIVDLPHTVVISSDWIVRWQGAPASLSAAILDQIVRADTDKNNADGRDPRKRWRP